ncbi:MAG: C_GCAxxG_C_C family protein [Candidatus Atribacteria bacterium]|nr:C_GCAxxG_C_C family protein [Candidatus Atribacteria bacterium]
MPEATVYHQQGFNCCESTLMGLCDYLGKSCQFFPRLATGFGGGFGHTGDVCGAITGSIMALGLKFGRDQAHDKKTRDDFYLLVEHFINDVKKELGAIDCIDLIGVPMNTEEGLNEYRKNNIHLKCREFIQAISQIAKEYLDQKRH